LFIKLLVIVLLHRIKEYFTFNYVGIYHFYKFAKLSKRLLLKRLIKICSCFLSVPGYSSTDTLEIVIVVMNSTCSKQVNMSYYLIYLTLHWPFLINLRLCSLSINSYEYSCHTIWTGLFNALFIWLIYGKVAQWLKFSAVNHDIMGSNPAKKGIFFIFVLFSWFLLNHFLSISPFLCFYLFKISTMHVHLTSYIKILKRYNYTADISL